MRTETSTSAAAIAVVTDLTAPLPDAGVATKENAREGKGRGKKGAKARKASKTLDVFEGLHSDEVDRLRGLAAEMNKLDRALTKDAFERGRMLETAFEILPVEKTFAAWIGQNCDFTARTARLYRSVVAELFEYEDRAIAGAVPKTVLFELAREAVTGEQIDAVLARFESGERLTVATVKRQLAGEAGAGPDSDPVDPLDIGGTDGLARLVRECVRSDLVAMRAEIAAIGTIIAETLAATPVDRNLKKAALMDAVFRHARLAAAFLGRAVFSRMEDPMQIGRMIEKRPPAASSWMRAHALLDRLGNKEAYPPINELRAWLEGEVMPALEWMSAKGCRPPLAVDAPATADVSASVEASAAVEASTISEVLPGEDVDITPDAEIEAAPSAPTVVAESPTDVRKKPAASKPAKAKAAKAKPTDERRTYRTPSGEIKVATRALTAHELAVEKSVNRMLNRMMR
jgi:hypothetical protein